MLQALTFLEHGHRLVALAIAACWLTSAVAIILFFRARSARLRLQGAMQYMQQGVSMFDKDQRLIVCNERYAEMFGLEMERLKPGVTLREVMQMRVESGVYPGTDPEDFIRSRLAIAAENKRAKTLLEFNDGRVFAALHQPTEDGGWLATFEDISDRMQAEGELARTREVLAEARAAAESAAREAQAAHHRLSEAVDAVPEGLVLFDADDRYVLWNKRYAEVYARREGELALGMRFEDMLRIGLARGDYPDACGREEEWLADRLARHALPYNSHEQGLTDDRWVRVEERRTSDGGSIGVRIDITELKRREASFRLLFKSNPLPMWVYDRTTLQFLAVNKAAVAHYGYSREDFMAMSTADIEAPPEPLGAGDAFAAIADDSAGRTVRHVKADGTRIDVAVYLQTLTYDGHDAALAAAIDMTERMLADKRIKHLAHHDALTDLPNRAALAEYLGQSLARAAASGERFGVLCMDLDYFKQANDVFGHSVGDELLCQVSRRLEANADGAFLARVGGDEFTLVCASVDQPAAAAALAERLLAAFREDFVVDGQVLRIGLSVGVAIYPGDGTNEILLIGNADAALYRAKAEGRFMVRFFEPQMDQLLREQRSLYHDLKRAIERQELALHYQPQAFVEGKIFGFEALIRWHHSKRGMIPPGVFIPIAEEHGLIAPIGEWVLREACREAASWSAPLQIAVNLSPLQFRHGDLPTLVHEILFSTGLAPERLELEITEGVLIEDPTRVMAILRRLKALGVKIAMDDFGTGYSSLSSLQSFPFDKIKIDRTFIAGIDSSGQSAAIVRAVIGLGHGLNLPVIAEGVETESQRNLLQAESCDEIQGYLVGHPLPIENYVDLTHGVVMQHPVAVQAR